MPPSTRPPSLGESNPAIKQEKSPVYAGSVIEAGDLVIRVEKVGADTSLAQIIHLVEEAQTRRAPVQNFDDKMANLLVPISFIGAAIVYRGHQRLAARPSTSCSSTSSWPEIVDSDGHLGSYRRGSPQGDPHRGGNHALKTWPTSTRSSSTRPGPSPWASPRSTTSKPSKA